MEPAESKMTSILASFDRFYNHYTSTCRERDEYAEQLKFLKSAYEKLQTNNDKQRKDVNEMHDMVKNFHEQVTQIDKLRDSNRDLKERLASLEQEINTKEQQYEIKLQEERNASDEKLKLVLKAAEKDAEVERQHVFGQLEEKDTEILKLQEAIASAKKEKQDEITVLSMEYENKLAKVQRQKSQILQNTQQATSQDIFRKKLQHMKKSHEEEVASLKQQIGQLQGRTAGRPQPGPSAPPPQHCTAAFATRIKRK